MKYAVRILGLAMLTITATACSNQMVYNLIQNNQRYECYTLPAGQQDDCLDKYQMSYGQYLNARRDWAEYED